MTRSVYLTQYGCWWSMNCSTFRQHASSLATGAYDLDLIAHRLLGRPKAIGRDREGHYYARTRGVLWLHTLHATAADVQELLNLLEETQA